MLTAQGVTVDPGELDAAYVAIRAAADASNYGRWITDEACDDVANAVVLAVENWRNAKPL